MSLLYEGDDSFEALVRKKPSPTEAIIDLAADFRSPRHHVWGIIARNREQNFALNMLMDPELDSSPCSEPPAPARHCWP